MYKKNENNNKIEKIAATAEITTSNLAAATTVTKAKTAATTITTKTT